MMSGKTNQLRFVALLLGILFLAAQFHFCADLSSDPSSSHICPVCSAAGSVVATASPSIVMVPVTRRLEVPAVAVLLSLDSPHAISPRAPPAQ
jgi:hypothetical protein